MSLPWKIILVVLLVLASWLLYRDVTIDRSFPLRNGSECLATNVVYLTNVVHELRVNDLGNVTNNIAPNMGIQESNKLESMQPRNKYFRGDFVFGCASADKWVYFDGDLFKVGCPSEFGRVVLLERDFVVCIDDDGNTTYLLPRKSNENVKNAPPYPARGTLQAVHGRGGAKNGSWLYPHTGTVKE